MAHLRNRKGTWYAEFYDPTRHPIRKEISLRTKDKVAARSRLVDLEREHARGDYDPWADRRALGGVVLRNAIELYQKSRTDRREKTRRADKSMLGQFRDGMHAACTVQQVERRHIEAYIDQPKQDGTRRSDTTRLTYYARLSAFFNWCVSEGMIRTSPMTKVRKPKAGARAPAFLTRTQYAHLLEFIEGVEGPFSAGGSEGAGEAETLWAADIVRVAVGTGMRLSEICSLTWAGVDLDTHIVTVRNTASFKTKSGHERSIPVEGDALAVLERRAALPHPRTGYVFTGARGGPLEATFVSKRFKKYVVGSGLPGHLRFHDLRHTYASWLVMSGTSLYITQAATGHSTPAMVQRYAHLAPDVLRAAVKETFGSA